MKGHDSSSSNSMSSDECERYQEVASRSRSDDDGLRQTTTASDGPPVRKQMDGPNVEGAEGYPFDVFASNSGASSRQQVTPPVPPPMRRNYSEAESGRGFVSNGGENGNASGLKVPDVPAGAKRRQSVPHEGASTSGAARQLAPTPAELAPAKAPRQPSMATEDTPARMPRQPVPTPGLPAARVPQSETLTKRHSSPDITGGLTNGVGNMPRSASNNVLVGMEAGRSHERHPHAQMHRRSQLPTHVEETSGNATGTRPKTVGEMKRPLLRQRPAPTPRSDPGTQSRSISGDAIEKRGNRSKGSSAPGRFTGPVIVPRRGSSAASLESAAADTGPWSLKWTLDKNGRKPGEIRTPKDVCFLRSGDIAICEEKNARVQIFSKTGHYQQHIDSQSDNELVRPCALCEAPNGKYLLVADASHVHFFDESGTCADFCAPGKLGIQGMALLPGNLVLSESRWNKKPPKVAIYTLEGKKTHKLNADFKNPSYVEFNREHNVISVSDSDQHCVYLFDTRGAKVGKLQNLGSDAQKLVWPSGMAISATNDLLLADRACDVILQYDYRAARFLPPCLTSEDGIKSPVAVASNGSNKIIVTEELHDFKKDSYKVKLFRQNKH